VQGSNRSFSTLHTGRSGATQASEFDASDRRFQYPSYGSKRCNHCTLLSHVAKAWFQYPSYGSKRCNCEKTQGETISISFSTLHTGRSGATTTQILDRPMAARFSTLHTGRSGATRRETSRLLPLISFQYPSYGSKRCNVIKNHGRIVAKRSFSTLHTGRSGATRKQPHSDKH